MKVTNWNKHKDKWSHTKGIQFLKPSSKKKIDILLGKYYPQLHTSIKEERKNEIQLQDLHHWGGHVLGNQLLTRLS